jgi:hypothetical protein
MKVAFGSFAPREHFRVQLLVGLSTQIVSLRNSRWRNSRNSSADTKYAVAGYRSSNAAAGVAAAGLSFECSCWNC